MGFLGSFKRQIKKRIRLKRRWLSLGVWLLALGGICWYGVSQSESLEPVAETFLGVNEPGSSMEGADKPTEVMLRTIYVCGEELASLGVRKPDEIHRLALDHPDWEYLGVIDHKAIFEAHVDDLSAECKNNSYIGIDDFGNLTLFNGPPQEEKVMKTFFQIDVRYLESSLPGEVLSDLRKGIRIRDISEYNSVLSTFSDFAVDETEKVMKPQR